MDPIKRPIEPDPIEGPSRSTSLSHLILAPIGSITLSHSIPAPIRSIPLSHSIPAPTRFAPCSNLIPAPIGSAPCSNLISAPTGSASHSHSKQVPTVSTLTYTPTVHILVSTTITSSLVEEEMQFWSKFNFEAEGVDFCLPTTTIVEAPKGTRFAMQRNVALLQRENAILKNSLVQVMQQQSSLEEQLKKFSSEHQQFGNQVPKNPFDNSRNYSNSHMHGVAQSQHFHDMSHPVSYSFPNGQGVNLLNQGFSNLQHPFVVPQFQGLPNSFPSSSTNFVPPIAPIYGNNVYNYQSFDIERFSSRNNAQGSLGWNPQCR